MSRVAVNELPYRFRTMHEVVDTVDYKGKLAPIPRNAFRKLGSGSLVKLCVEARGKDKPAPEEIWCIVYKRNSDQTLFGRVNTHTYRFMFHGLKFNAPIHFRNEHILDIAMQKATEVKGRN